MTGKRDSKSAETSLRKELAKTLHFVRSPSETMDQQHRRIQACTSEQGKRLVDERRVHERDDCTSS